MKKILALLLAGALVVSMSVMTFASENGTIGKDLYEEIFNANNNPSYETIWNRVEGLSDEEWCKLNDYITAEFPDYDDWEEHFNAEWTDFLYYPPDVTVPGGSCGSSSDDEDVVFDRGSEAEALAIQATGIPMATTLAAADENKSVGEYMNNAVVAAPGLDNAVPVSQGGNVIINGAPSNQTFSVLKVLSGHTEAAKAQAASIGGRVLNVARIDASVYFDTATVNFYMPGVKTGQNVQVYQYDYVSGSWVGVAVAEVRDDHVVVDMTSLGILAFIEVPAAE